MNVQSHHIPSPRDRLPSFTEPVEPPSPPSLTSGTNPISEAAHSTRSQVRLELAGMTLKTSNPCAKIVVASLLAVCAAAVAAVTVYRSSA